MSLSQRNQVQTGGNMSSMTDLVFLLLIFFVILSTLVANGVNVDLPQSEGTSSANTKVTVSIKPSSTAGEVEVYLDGTREPKDRVRDKLRSIFDDQDNPVLYLQVDKSVPTGTTVEWIGLAKANNWKVMLGAEPAR